MKFIRGVCAVEGWSHNKRYYSKSLLEKLHGKVVPLLLEHIGSPETVFDNPTKTIGKVKLFWDGDKLTFFGYVSEANTTDVLNPVFNGVSIGAHYIGVSGVVIGIHLEEVSLVAHPAIEGTSITEAKEYDNFDYTSKLKVLSAYGLLDGQC